jgi:hypothetical protein
MAFAGLRGTGDWGTDERPKNFREMILWRNPNGSSPLMALLGKARSEKVNDPEFAWWEEELTITRITTNADLSTTSTSVSTAGGALALVPGDVLLVEVGSDVTYDNEIVVVSSVASDTSFVIKRAQANTTAAGIASGSNLTRIGSVFAEGTVSPDVSQTNPVKVNNYCQIFKTAYELTKTAENTKIRTGDPLKNDKKRTMFKHSVNLEHQFIWGKKHETTGANGKPMRFTGGLRQFITSNVKVFSTTPTVDTFLDAVYKVFDYEGENGGSDERIVLAGNGFLNALNKMVKDSTQIRYDGKITVYGMKLLTYIIPQGTLAVKTHPLMNVHPKFQNSAFILHASGLRYRYMRDTTPQDNIQAPDADTRKGQWLTECGLELHHEKMFGYIGNFTVP